MLKIWIMATMEKVNFLIRHLNMMIIMANFVIAEKRAFLDLILSAARGGAELSDTSIQNEVDSFMFAVRALFEN